VVVSAIANIIERALGAAAFTLAASALFLTKSAWIYAMTFPVISVFLSPVTAAVTISNRSSTVLSVKATVKSVSVF
jgi:preprotein translocase subunit SecG